MSPVRQQIDDPYNSMLCALMASSMASLSFSASITICTTQEMSIEVSERHGGLNAHDSALHDMLIEEKSNRMLMVMA